MSGTRAESPITMYSHMSTSCLCSGWDVLPGGPDGEDTAERAAAQVLGRECTTRQADRLLLLSRILFTLLNCKVGPRECETLIVLLVDPTTHLTLTHRSFTV